MKHALDVRVYYEDTDAGGVVYHANYLKFAERARAEFLREIGFSSSDLHESRGIIFVVRYLEIDYLKTAHLDDFLQLFSTITELKNSSFTMQHRVMRDDMLVSDMRVALVCIDAETLKPVRLPEDIKQAFQAYQEPLE